jgi:hypothetical protein
MSDTADKDVDLSNPTLLCISDLEGCLQQSQSKIQQSQKLCETETFTAIGKLLENNDKLQVAFLGDYFDQGDKMESSIAGIVGLKENATYGNRVHIILGNRDVNKMRICVEAFKKVTYSGPGMWSLWKDFLYGKVENGKHTPIQIANTDENPKFKPLYDPTLSDIQRCKQLLANTYAAPNLLAYAGNTDETLGFNRMRAIFQTVEGFTDDHFVQNCRKLFYHGELIKVIDVGSKKVLVSHAGTNNANIFKFTDKTQLRTSKSEKFDNDMFSYDITKYFDSIEIARDLLQTPLQTHLKFGDSIEYYNRLYQNLVRKIIDATGNIIASLPQLLESESNEDARTNYFLLQAMGLKADTENTGNFLSPIESCGLSGGCMNFNAFPEEFGQLLNNNDINAIAHGHIPFCGTVPLIHVETVNEMKIGVLSCDTSNGNRPGVYVTLDIIPLGYIQESGIGIASIHNQTLTRENTKGFKNDGTEPDLYKPMVGHFNYDNLPELISNNGKRNQINYGTTSFKFSSNGMFKPLEKVQSGGKSRRKRRRGSKRKSGKKYSRKIRKVRYLKHKCSHGCRH